MSDFKNRDYKYLANKLDRQREFDLKAYPWDDSVVRYYLKNICQLIIIAVVMMACVVGWMNDSF